MTGSSISSESGSGTSSGYGFRVVMTKNWKKNTGEIFHIFFFLSKTTIYLSLGLHKGHPSYRRGLQPSKENIQHLKI
jgi:hypothetical protein